MRITVPTDLDAQFAAEIEDRPDEDLRTRRRQLADVVLLVPYDSHAWREGHKLLDTLDYVRMQRAAHGLNSLSI